MPDTPAFDARAPLDRRRVLIGGALLATAASAAALEPRKAINILGKAKLEDVVPAAIGPWRFHSKSGLVIPPQDALSEQLYTQLLTRVYVAPDQPPVMLLVAQGASQTGVIQVHRPEVCYPTGGYQLSPSRSVEIAVPGDEIHATGFTATADTRIEQLIYWTRIGRDRPRTWAEQRLSVARANLRGELPDAVLVRVSTLMPDSDGAFALLSDFVRAFVQSLAPRTRAFMVGPPVA